MAFPGLTHTAVTVTDLDRSAAFYEKLFDAKPVLDEDTGPFHHKAWLLDGGSLFAIHAFPDLVSTDPCNERRPGIDHVSFGVSSRSELEKCQSRLEELGIEHGGIVDAHYGSGLSFRDPDNIPLEFFAPPG